MGDDDHTGTHGTQRRGFLKLGAALAVAAAIPWSVDDVRRGAAAASRNSVTAAGESARRLAMHIHSSFSEMTGSMHGHLQQAMANGFDAIFFTEHDWRALYTNFRREYHFTPNEPETGGTWGVASLPNLPAGSFASSAGGLVSSPVTPNYPAGGRKGSLRLAATNSGSTARTKRFRIDDGFSRSRANHHGNIAGRLMRLDAMLTKGNPNAYAEVYFLLSHHPGSGGRGAGQCQLRYRLRPDVTHKTISVTSDGTGPVAVVDLPMPVGSWRTFAFDLVSDLNQAWPSEDGRDNALNQVEFRVTSSRGAAAEAFFSYLRFDQEPGWEPIGVQRDMLTRLATKVGYHGLARVGNEYSLVDDMHINGFGSFPTAFHYDQYGNTGVLYPSIPGIGRHIVDAVHAAGGIASYNHPFGHSQTKPELPRSTQDRETRALITNLLGNDANGADLLEMGFRLRDGVNLDHHIQVLDALWRNGVYITGNGSSDDHLGVDWAHYQNRWYTSAWSTGATEPAILAALSAGRAFVGELGSFGGTLDLEVVDEGSSIPMGSASTSTASSRQYRIGLTGLPSGGAVQVVRGVVDNAGTRDPRANTSVVKSLNASQLASTGGLISLGNADPNFVRLQVVNSSGRIVAVGQPLWTLHGSTAQVPPNRRR